MRSHRGRPTINKHIQERRVMIESVCWLLSLTIVAGVFVFAAISSRAGGGVLASPQLSITNCLADSFEAKLSTRKYPTEQQILLTNCVAWSGYGTTTNDSRQNLSNLTVTVVAGSATAGRTQEDMWRRTMFGKGKALHKNAHKLVGALDERETAKRIAQLKETHYSDAKKEAPKKIVPRYACADCAHVDAVNKLGEFWCQLRKEWRIASSSCEQFVQRGHSEQIDHI